METVFDTSLSMTELAKEAGVSISYISHVAKGNKPMSLKLQFAIWGMGTTINGEPLTEWHKVFKEARIRAELTQEKLAELAGYKGKTSIIRIENRKTRAISPAKFRELCTILNIKGLPKDEHHTVQNKPQHSTAVGDIPVTNVTTDNTAALPGTESQSKTEDGLGTSGERRTVVPDRDNGISETASSDSLSTEG